MMARNSERDADREHVARNKNNDLLGQRVLRDRVPLRASALYGISLVPDMASLFADISPTSARESWQE